MITGNPIRAFDWCQNQRPWMTLKGHYALCFKTHASFGAHHENLNEDRQYCQRRRCSLMTLDSDNIRFMGIFAVVLKIYVNFPDFTPAPHILRIHVPHAFSLSSKFNCFVYYSYYICQYGCGGVVKCGLADM